MGVSKVNFNKLILDTCYEYLEANAGKLPHTVLMEQGMQCVVKRTIEWMKHSGSAGKAFSG